MIGTTLAHYTILERIGRGGMGEVFRARDARLGRDVAIKVLPPELAGNPEARERFEREARAVAALQHPNIVTLHSVEEADGILLITMELVAGRTLADLIPASGMSREEFLRVALPLTDAVTAAHARGILHRDLKPLNVMVDSKGWVKVLDFGLAKFWMRDAETPEEALTRAHATAPGTLLGTAAYMSPEQISGGAIDGRSDIFSLGIIFYELLTGTRPFTAAHAVGLLYKIVHEEPAPLEGVDPDLVELVTRCLSKTPADRYQTASDLRAGLTGGSMNTEGASLAPRGAVTVDSSAPRDAVRRGAYREAADLLLAAQSERELTAQELELLAEALRWLDDVELLLQTNESAFALYSQANDHVSAARVALNMAGDSMFKNAVSVARGWLRRVERLLEKAPPCVEVGYLRRRQVMETMQAGDLDRARTLNTECAEIARTFGDRDLEVVALHDEGQILIATGQVEAGTERIDEAMAVAMSGETSHTTLGNLYCRTMSVCKNLSDYKRAREWSEAAWRWCGPLAENPYQGVCRVHNAETLRHHGDWTQAEEAARRAYGDFSRSGHRDHAGTAMIELGQLAMRRGDLDEAEAAFREAHELGCDPVPGLPLLRLAQGKPGAALQTMDRALHGIRDPLRRAHLLPAHFEIAMAAGKPEEAARSIEELSRTAAAYSSPGLGAQALLGQGWMALVGGDAGNAATLLHEAWSLFKELALPYDAARARVLLGRAYRDLGATEDARMELESARKCFIGLGAGPNVEDVDQLLASLN